MKIEGVVVKELAVHQDIPDVDVDENGPFIVNGLLS